MGREAGGGFRMGNTCTPVADAWLQHKVKSVCFWGKKDISFQYYDLDFVYKYIHRRD